MKPNKAGTAVNSTLKNGMSYSNNKMSTAFTTGYQSVNSSVGNSSFNLTPENHLVESNSEEDYEIKSTEKILANFSIEVSNVDLFTEVQKVESPVEYNTVKSSITNHTDYSETNAIETYNLNFTIDNGVKNIENKDKKKNLSMRILRETETEINNEILGFQSELNLLLKPAEQNMTNSKAQRIVKKSVTKFFR